MNYQTQLSLLAMPEDVRHVDNRWDLLPLELKHMIVDKIVKPQEAAARAYWKVCFKRVLGQIIYFTHCQDCGDTLIPITDTRRLGNRKFICPKAYRTFLRMSKVHFASFLTHYWNLHVPRRHPTKRR